MVVVRKGVKTRTTGKTTTRKVGTTMMTGATTTTWDDHRLRSSKAGNAREAEKLEEALVGPTAPELRLVNWDTTEVTPVIKFCAPWTIVTIGTAEEMGVIVRRTTVLPPEPPTPGLTAAPNPNFISMIPLIIIDLLTLTAPQRATVVLVV